VPLCPPTLVLNRSNSDCRILATHTVLFDVFRLGSLNVNRATETQRPFWLLPKYIFSALVALMFAYVLQHNESFLVHPHAPVWKHYEPFKWWLLAHSNLC
jgi:hypothetical protein